VYEAVSRAVDLDHVVVQGALRMVGASWLPPHVRHMAAEVERVREVLDGA
jgi:hypothetical protein